MTAYLGYVATRAEFPNALDTAHNTCMSRSYHVAKTPITQLQIAIPAWYDNGTPAVETGTTGTITATASIEYGGAISRITFGGANSSAITNGSFVVSDLVTVPGGLIPAGAPFFIRIFISNGSASSLVQQTNIPKPISLGEAQIFATGGTDLTGSTAAVVDTAGANVSFGPCAIIGITSQPSFAILADSRSSNTFDSINNLTADTGEIARTVGGDALDKGYAYVNGGTSGDTISGFLGSHTNRLAMTRYASHVILQLGYNDLAAGTDVNQVLSVTQRVRSLMPADQNVVLTTKMTRTSSTDSWATTTGQTPFAPFVSGASGPAALYNDWVRSIPSSYFGYMEVADILMTGRDTDYWISNGSANGFTQDGIHPNAAACQLISKTLLSRDNGFITTKTFNTPKPNAVPTPITLANLTNATVGTAATIVLNANPNAKYRCFINTGTTIITIMPGSVGGAGQGIVLPPAPTSGPPSMYEMYLTKGNLDIRQVFAISSAAGGTLEAFEGW